MTKYRIVEQKLSDGKVQWAIQKKLFNLFWVLVKLDVPFGYEVLVYNNLAICKGRLEKLLKEEAKVVEEKVIKCGDEES